MAGGNYGFIEIMSLGINSFQWISLVGFVIPFVEKFLKYSGRISFSSIVMTCNLRRSAASGLSFGFTLSIEHAKFFNS